MNARAGRFPLVDSLRALAALSILGYHLAGYSGAYGVPVLVDLSIQLQAGVALFFLISGFLLYRPFLVANVAEGPAPNVGAYAWRRFLRVVPAYWAALTVLALVEKPQVFSGGHAPLFYGFAQVYDSGQTLNGLGVAWSLCVEVAFYVLLPLLALGVRHLPASGPRARLRREAAMLVALIVIALAFRAWAVEGGAQVLGSPLVTLPAFLDWFALGMGLALLTVWLGRRPGAMPRPLAWVERRPGLSWLAAGAGFGLCAVASANLPDKGVAENLSVHVLSGLVGLGLLLPAVVGATNLVGVRRVMANRVLAWLGLVSYGIFLWQIPVLTELGQHTPLGAPSFLEPNLLWLVVAPPVVVAVAALSYYGLERPALSLKRLVPARGGTAEQPGAASAPPVPGAR